ncbi:MAG TPA: flavohemoglobin expression-modulating QEGLA motif protein [Gammaproteobacteria bacterium]|nr:flavohemoglobin expression-modulating QEGLA motif protein [Gammaproteobacteria bacterium]HQZ88235.1 flavohemoglobin expression-modulating QEGLA motif protein [Gammaproteobacteria bacterium]
MNDIKYHQVIRELSEKIVAAQRPIRILDALKWNSTVEEAFFKSGCKELPNVRGPEFYLQNPLKFDPDKKIDEFNQIERDIRRELGQFNSVGSIMQRMCREYCTVVEMLNARGTPHFTRYAQQLYGSADDAFYAGAPTLTDLAILISNTLSFIEKKTGSELDQKKYTGDEAVSILGQRLSKYFEGEKEKTCVKLSDDIIADAAAGAEFIKLRKNAMFSERDLRVLEVHEGWVHLGTTLNGMSQPICTFLSKGPPSSTITQEGLAIIMEIFTFSSHPARIQGLTDRIRAINMAEKGGNFLDVFNFFREQGYSEAESYTRTARVFRGSTAESGPFTKDLVYNKGFILIYNYIRLAIQQGLLSRIPLLFLGKATLEDLHILNDLVEEGIVAPPKYVPPQFKDLAALSSWMCYSLFLNQLDLKRLAQEYKEIL